MKASKNDEALEKDESFREGGSFEEGWSFEEGQKLQRKIKALEENESLRGGWKSRRRMNALEEDKAKVVHCQEFTRICSESQRMNIQRLRTNKIEYEEDFFPKD